MTPKQRYFNKKYREAPFITCACGCGTEMKAVDRYARPRRYISGHNTPAKYDDPTQYKREWNHRNRRSRYIYKTDRAHSHKVRLLKLLGGKCTKCSEPYNGKNASIFDFHHKDTSTKKFGLNLATFHRRSILEIDKEAKKCRILCANCHRSFHSEDY